MPSVTKVTQRRGLHPTPTSRSNRPEPMTGVLSRIKPIGFDEDEGIKIMIYGRSGTGKTTLWSTFPSPILVAICSGGIKPGELRSIDTAENRKRISQVVIQSSGEIQEVIAHAHQTGKYKTIVLDHVSGLQDLILKEIMGLDEIPMVKYRAAGKGESWGLVSQQQYGQCSAQMREHLRDLLNLDGNVVIVGQERTDKNENDSELLLPNVGVAVQPGVALWLNPAVDYIGQTLIRRKEVIKERTQGVGKQARVVKVKVLTNEVIYCLRTGPDSVYTTKFRKPLGRTLPDYIMNPTYEKIYDIIRGVETEE